MYSVARAKRRLVGNPARSTVQMLLAYANAIVPALTVGFTDSRFIRPLGAQVYGFNPHHPNSDPNRSGVHGNNEYLEIETLLLRTKNAVALACLTLGIK